MINKCDAAPDYIKAVSFYPSVSHFVVLLPSLFAANNCEAYSRYIACPMQLPRIALAHVRLAP
jgi:hypothetical protein